MVEIIVPQNMIAEAPDLFQSVQGALIPRYPGTPGFKREGTSRQAAVAIKPRAATLRDSVLRVLRQRPSTADEVAAVIGETILATRPRLSELNKAGKIVETSERRRNASGKFATVWRAIAIKMPSVGGVK